MFLCVEQARTTHVVYEIQEPANGGIGALTEIDRAHARAHARKLSEAGLIEAGAFTIALYGRDDRPLDQQPGELGPRPLATVGG